MFEWAVIGDSWASGVAYNSSNIYGPLDREECYRTKEAWGAQMNNDDSWVDRKYRAFGFAACGGTLMNDLKRQMQQRAGRPQVVWGMFGGNNAHFGAIARACIYQPYSPEHPFGWGPPWDEDPDDKGLCKQNIKAADDYIHNGRFRKELVGALNDIFSVSQTEDHKKSQFDLYLSSYVQFFDATTDECDQWSFAHDRVSSGHPKVVKGLRDIINKRVLDVNNLQADVVNNYKIPEPKLPNYKIHNVQPDSLFKGHRFCEKGWSYEDQFYHKDLWFWNLQYYDEQAEKEIIGVAKTDDKGVQYMTYPDGISGPENVTVLAAEEVEPQQYGFGWTARPFHPKYDGHKAMKEFFIRKMKDDKIPGVKTEATSQPKPSIQQKKECYGLGNKKYIGRDVGKDIIETELCPKAAGDGSVEESYNKGTMEEVTLSVKSPSGFKPSKEDCIKGFRDEILDGCDGNDPKNPENYKGGGKVTMGDVTYEMIPRALRQPADKSKKGFCDSTYKYLFNEYWMWGNGFASSDYGKTLKSQVADCALLPNTWTFEYGLGDDGREWTARFRTGIFQKGCVGNAGKEAGGPSDFNCNGSG
ncbi:hypothetical protein JX265_001861 [Neoarthrinium moseri]|uniref:SGNH hydrolase-type esterase domain-containing protein n=1 Tax=Neoarthrinium moseri TaxID=1658444 RepID=A0A9P9WVY1_9PEZI|nr:hypothetical protein JX265_001861 [Neoarthrinium moseri]